VTGQLTLLHARGRVPDLDEIEPEAQTVEQADMLALSQLKIADISAKKGVSKMRSQFSF
jgi:hypothetical protein